MKKMSQFLAIIAVFATLSITTSSCKKGSKPLNEELNGKTLTVTRITYNADNITNYVIQQQDQQNPQSVQMQMAINPTAEDHTPSSFYTTIGGWNTQNFLITQGGGPDDITITMHDINQHFVCSAGGGSFYQQRPSQDFLNNVCAYQSDSENGYYTFSVDKMCGTFTIKKAIGGYTVTRSTPNAVITIELKE